MEKKSLKFAIWFESQFGKRPLTPSARERLLARAETLKSDLDYYTGLLEEDAEIRSKCEAAYYAWNAAKDLNQ